ncbi:MAG: photosystem II reaction center protein Ycf12 [Cyanobacteriota bacterium]|nr:MAG: photosystem II reaction center protein Ycf12 [Cyanobacteriota bacterium]
MNLQIIFQLASILLILGAGPLVIVLLASRSGNL